MREGGHVPGGWQHGLALLEEGIVVCLRLPGGLPARRCLFAGSDGSGGGDKACSQDVAKKRSAQKHNSESIWASKAQDQIAGIVVVPPDLSIFMQSSDVVRSGYA